MCAVGSPFQDKDHERSRELPGMWGYQAQIPAEVGCLSPVTAVESQFLHQWGPWVAGGRPLTPLSGDRQLHHRTLSSGLSRSPLDSDF